MAHELSSQLSKFDPLPRIILYDNFDNGLEGWTGLIGNYEDTLDSVLPGYRDLRPPMLSNATMWDTGSAGALDGVYSMKLATRPEDGGMGVGIKRVTWRHAGPIQFEAYVTFKPEASELRLSELDVRAFGVLFDLQNEKERVMPHLRYLNALEGEPVGRWQYKKDRVSLETIGGTGKTQSHFHLSSDGWLDLPAEPQALCYNEISTKQNWHYIRIGFDLASMTYTSFQCNDREYDVSNISPMVMPAMANLWCMLNVAFWIETDLDKRAFLFVDSVTLSGDWIGQ
ncbi:MAG TPA: hypothetical protein DIU35_08075 [Candidatus Latescibacteria bacterium]|nr:hypothetical protein [Gemmatimonadota bacterium]HCR17426.1 hypothetical protein [Candidatus Latescibacterota bacterium]